jgi:hypothetical protein
MEEIERRSKEDRREYADRRISDNPNFTGTERRSELDRRSGEDRRGKDENVQSSHSRIIKHT